MMPTLLAFLLPLFSATARLGTPLACAALGGVVSERSGVIALGLEGMMLAGSFASVAVTVATGNVLFGLIAGVLAGAVVGWLHAFFCLTLRVSHVLSGVALNLGVLGLTTFAVRRLSEGLSTRTTLPPEPLFLLTLLLTAGVTFVLWQTVPGLRLRACGENPQAALTAGLNIRRISYIAVVVSGALAGLGGVVLALAGLGTFTENMTAGRGYIALAAVIFGRWHALGAVGAAFLFGFGDALQLSLQTAGLSRFLPPDLLNLFPYLLTLLILTLRRRDTNAPAALGKG